MKTFVSLLLLLFAIKTYSKDIALLRTRIIHTFHTTNMKIHGISFGAFSTMADKRNILTNGLRLEVPGVGIVSFMGNGFPNATRPFHLKNHFFSEVVNGLNVSSGSWCNCNYNGLTIAVAGQFGILANGLSFAGGWNIIDKQNGVQISSIVNSSYYLKGLQIAAINYANEGSGLQVGIINKSKKHKGIQIGLWNINGKRQLPFINWRFNT